MSLRTPGPVRRAALAAVAIAASLSLSSCLVLPFVDDGAAPTRSAAPSAPGGGGNPTTPPKPDLARFYSQQLSWRTCPGGECATLEVPLDYANPGNGSTLKIAVLRVKARNTGARLGSLVVNPGGPGGSGVEYASYADQIVRKDVRDRFDIVGFDPRGVADSSPVQCLDPTQMDDFLGIDPTPDTAEEKTAFVAMSKKLADACQAKHPQLLPHLTTEDAARDMDVLRAALGESKLTYLGKSYGTYLGAVYAGLFPQRSGRLVLDGVVAPELSSQQLSEGQARGFELATRSFVADCVKRSGCPVGTTVDEGMQWIRDFLKQVDGQPLPVTNDARVKQLTEGWASWGLAYAMYSKQAWPLLVRALTAAKNGSGNELMGLANRYARRSSNGAYQGNLLQAMYAVNCVDREDTADIATIDAAAAAAEKDAPTWGKALLWGGVPCGVWPVKPTKAPATISAQGAEPIVVIGTTRDPATIYEWAVLLRKQLAAASLITFDGDGHTAYTSSNSCVDGAVDAYFISGKLPADGLKC